MKILFQDVLLYNQFQKWQRSCFYLLLYITYTFKIKNTQFWKFVSLLNLLKMYISNGVETSEYNNDPIVIIFTLKNHLDN